MKSVTTIGECAFGYDLSGKNPDFKIYGFKDSAAYTYALNNEIEFVEITE